ncbi:hypothetical protein [Escherichia albertii]|nr:hypothetical protein [Escherichia albertii]
MAIKTNLSRNPSLRRSVAPSLSAPALVDVSEFREGGSVPLLNMA